MKVSRDKLMAFIWALPLTCLSLILLPYAVVGDQFYYRAFYEQAGYLSLREAFTFYNYRLSTSEPGYFIFVYATAAWLQKDVAFSMVNGILYYNMFLWLARQRVSLLLYPLLVCNFYLVVLSFSAERLKYALVVFFIGCSLSGFFKYLTYGFSLVSHVQLVLLLACTQVTRLLDVLKSLRYGRVGAASFSLLLLCFGALGLLLFLREHIQQKFEFYYGTWGGVHALIKPLMFMGMAIFYSRGRGVEAFFVSLPMLLASFFIGSERVVIFSYLVFMYYSVTYRNGLNIGVLASTTYFAWQGVNFVFNMIMFGDGFASTY